VGYPLQNPRTKGKINKMEFNQEYDTTPKSPTLKTIYVVIEPDGYSYAFCSDPFDSYEKALEYLKSENINQNNKKYTYIKPLTVEI